jgi:uncharacterized membrane protein
VIAWRGIHITAGEDEMAGWMHVAALVLQINVRLPQGGTATEEMALRWVHLLAGITWIGLLYFFNWIGFPTMRELKPSVRMEVYPALMSRAMWWFRWSALVTVLAGIRYFMMVLAADAQNAGNPRLAFQWLGGWFGVWLAAYALLYALQMPMKGALDNGWLRAVGIAAVVIAASWVVLRLNSNPLSSNSHLSISVGGGLGLVMLLNVWGIVWRAQKRLIGWHRAAIETGAAIPPESAKLQRWTFIAARTAFWLSLPMLFLMGAADHYPFLSGITD